MTIQSFAISAPYTTVSPIRLAGISHILFESWTDRFPESVAVTGEWGSWTYLKVEQRSNQVAHALRSAGVKRGDFVATFLERCPDLVCALMGILKAGAAFVALDPKTPKEGLARIFASIDCRFVLSRRRLAAGLPPTSTQQLLFDEISDWLSRQPSYRLLSVARPDDPACAIFTSGSADHPKAVLYLHQNLATRFSNTTQVSNADSFSVFAQTSPITSIDAIDEIFVPLVNGGSTAILPYDTVTNPHRLIDSLSDHKVTHILLVPSLLRVILSVEEDLDTKLSSLRTWMIGGEPLTGALTRQFYQKLLRAVLINFYGLTEGDATFHVTSSRFHYATGVPIGRPVQATKIYLLDENLKPVQEGQPGEICLAGAGLSHNYLNCPELNAERWVSNPFASDDLFPRLFRSGDMGRLNSDGEIEYIGRCDRMVRVRGFCVELGAMEAALAQHPAVDQCVAVTKDFEKSVDVLLQHRTYVIAYAVLKRGMTVSSQDLRNFLQDRLPKYAMPAIIALLDAFPLSPNGKVDFHVLSQLNPAAGPDDIETLC